MNQPIPHVYVRHSQCFIRLSCRTLKVCHNMYRLFKFDSGWWTIKIGRSSPIIMTISSMGKPLGSQNGKSNYPVVRIGIRKIWTFDNAAVTSSDFVVAF